SLTGGLLCATLVDVPGVSEVVRGAVVAYVGAVKSELLGVQPEHLAAYGAVDEGTAEQMAVGVRELLGATYGVATTGVAGPDPSEGKPVGTVHVCVAAPTGASSWTLALAGGRAEIRSRTVEAALSALFEVVGAPR